MIERIGILGIIKAATTSARPQKQTEMTCQINSLQACLDHIKKRLKSLYDIFSDPNENYVEPSDLIKGRSCKIQKYKNEWNDIRGISKPLALSINWNKVVRTRLIVMVKLPSTRPSLKVVIRKWHQLSHRQKINNRIQESCDNTIRAKEDHRRYFWRRRSCWRFTSGEKDGRLLWYINTLKFYLGSQKTSGS